MQELTPHLSLVESLSPVIKQLSHRSQRIYENDVKVFATWIQEQGLTPERLNEDTLIAYRAYLVANYAKATAQRMLSVTDQLLQELVHKQILLRNPMDRIKRLKVGEETTHTALNHGEAAQLLASIDRNTNIGKRDYALISLLLRTGLRRFECTALNIGDIRQEQGHTIALIRHGKGDQAGIVKLPVDVFRVLREYIEASDRQSDSNDAPIFVGFRKGDRPTSERLGEKAIERIVKHYSEMIGIPTLTPHGLRATFITLALEEKAPLHKVQYAARHKDPRTTERYQKRKLNLDDNAVDYIHIPEIMKVKVTDQQGYIHTGTVSRED